MTEGKKRVVLTGATGYIAGQMLPTLRERYDLTLVDVRGTNRDGATVPDVRSLEVGAAGGAVRARVFTGADAIIHTG